MPPLPRISASQPPRRPVGGSPRSRRPHCPLPASVGPGGLSNSSGPGPVNVPNGNWRPAMRRVVSLSLPTWSTDRWRRQMGAAAPPRETPLVLAGQDGQRRLVIAADQAAQALGLVPGLPLAQAQARVPGLHVETADAAADRAALERFGLWA